jgi:hypothetical protein
MSLLQILAGNTWLTFEAPTLAACGTADQDYVQPCIQHYG